MGIISITQLPVFIFRLISTFRILPVINIKYMFPSLQFLTKLTFSEFHELLAIVTNKRLCEVDPQLTPLHNMSVSWYQGLARILMVKYTDSHRHFTSTDGLIQYVVSILL